MASRNTRKTSKRQTGLRRRTRRIILVFLFSLLLVIVINFFMLLRSAFAGNRQQEISGDSSPQNIMVAGRNAAPAAQDTPIKVNAEPLLQRPELPNGCEATALTMALQALGYSCDKLTIAYDYIPSEGFYTVGQTLYGPDPNTFYAGDPALSTGFYCLPGAVVTGAEAFLTAQDSAYTAVDVTGADDETLEGYLAQGCPVLLWVTEDFDSTALYCNSYSWRLSDGTDALYVPYLNLHCVLLCGYDDDFYYINNSMTGEEVHEKGTILACYEALGSYAVSFTAA